MPSQLNFSRLLLPSGKQAGDFFGPQAPKQTKEIRPTRAFRFPQNCSAPRSALPAAAASGRGSLLGRRSSVTAGRPALPPAPSHADLLGEFFADNSLLLQRHPHHSLIYHPELLPSLNFSLSKTLLFTCLILSFKVYVSREVVFLPLSSASRQRLSQGDS